MPLTPHIEKHFTAGDAGRGGVRHRTLYFMTQHRRRLSNHCFTSDTFYERDEADG